MFGLFTKRCRICCNILRRRKFRWVIDGQKVWLCRRCHVELEKQSSALAFDEDKSPRRATRKIGGCASFLVSFLVIDLALALAYMVWSGSPKYNPEDKKLAQLVADAGLPAVPYLTAEPSPPMETEAMPLPPEDDMILMQSTDGRTIRAQILTLTATHVIVRREDKAQFRIALNQFTRDTLNRIDAFRMKLPASVE